MWIDKGRELLKKNNNLSINGKVRNDEIRYKKKKEKNEQWNMKMENDLCILWLEISNHFFLYLFEAFMRH